ncbi:MAG: hypothetical protein WAT79_06260 [Saprospiraceae bacterium]
MVPLLLLLNSCQKNEKEIVQQANFSQVEKRNANCFDNSIEDICPNQTIKLDTLVLDSIPGYPVGCTFTIEYEFVDCQYIGFPNLYSYVIGDFNILDINCHKYEVDIDSIMMNLGIGSQTMADYMAGLYRKLVERTSEVVFTTYYKHLFDCTDTNNNLFTLSWIKASCERYCFVKPIGKGFYIGYPVECGTGCCITFIDLCWDSTLNKVVKIITTQQASSGECESPSSEPPGFCTLSSNCSFTCE